MRSQLQKISWKRARRSYRSCRLQNSEPDFTKQPKIADFASEYFCEELGESGVGSRAAVGVAVLLGEAPVEIAVIAGVGSIKY